MRLVVVGAGFAGLACADDLVRRGHDVRVFEARDRVGGRVWSQQLVPDDPRTIIERGAEFVLEGYDVLEAYVERLGLTLAPTGMSYFVREPRNATPRITADEVAAAAARMRPAARAVDAGTSLRDFLESQSHESGSARQALAARAAISWAADETELSAHVLLDSVASVEPLPTSRVAGGNQRIALALAAGLGDRIHLRTPIRTISDLGDHIEVVTEQDTLSADAVVVTIPLPLLERMAITPAIPQDQRAAMARMARGHAAKLHVLLTQTPAQSAVLDVGRRFWCWTATDASAQVQSILHCFAGSPRSLAGLDVVDGPGTWLEAARALRPDLDLSADGTLMTTWDDDPWATFAYSGISSRNLAGDSALIGRTHGRIFFAGEHTAGQQSGLMEGALRSGLHAAAQVDDQSQQLMTI